MNCPFCKGLGFVDGGDTCPHCVDEGLNPVGLGPLELIHIAENDKQPKESIVKVFISQVKGNKVEKTPVELGAWLSLIFVLDDEKGTEIQVASIDGTNILQVWADGSIMVSPVAQNMVQITPKGKL